MVLLLELFDAVVSLAETVVQLVLMGIDYGHRVANCSSKLCWGGAFNRHVGDQIRNPSHLIPSFTFGHDLHALIPRV